ncbi:MAG: patatin-like phospholipase family protein [Candidatus Cryptobacteroides sp.]
MKTKDVALVLSSGGPRGFAYIGAIEELESRGYHITSVAGCSIGSLVGGVYAAGGLEDFKQWLFRLNNSRLMSLLDVSLSKSYLVKGDKVMSAIKEVVPDVDIETLRIPYSAVATDLYTGEEVVFREGKLFDAIRASISIPSLFRPVRYGRHTLIDGGAVNTAPFSIVHRNGNDILVSFDVNRLDSNRIAENLARLEKIREDGRMDLNDIISEIRKHKTESILDFVKIAGDETIKAIEKNREADDKLKSASLMAEQQKTPFAEEDNYYSILSRTFSLMLRTISGLQIQMYKPDVLVTMSFDSYGSISDYARGEEISDLGRKLMSEALDKYEGTDRTICNF